MAVMASWNGKTWGVSPPEDRRPEWRLPSVELDTENSDDKAGSPATKTKALKLQSMSFDFDLASPWAATPRRVRVVDGAGRAVCPLLSGRPALRPGQPSAHRREPLRHHTRQPRPDPEGQDHDQPDRSTPRRPAAKRPKIQQAAQERSSSSPAGVSSSGGVGRRLSAVTVGASSSDKAAKKPNNNAQLK